MAAVAILSAAGCQEARPTYADAEYIMFADEESVNIIQEGSRTFCVPVASTVACDYDRNVGVEVLDGKSSAIEGLHYTVASNTVTIKAGERVADVEITADYDRMESLDTLNVTLRLLVPESVKWDLYGDETNVKMVKSEAWSARKYTGWCVVSSALLYNYPGNNSSIQRLIYTEQDPTDDKTVVLHSFLYDGYDVRIRFKTDDADKPHIAIEKDQILGNSREIFFTVHGDGNVLVAESPYYDSYFMALNRYAVLYLYVYVEDLGDAYGVVDFYSQNVLEWVTNEEAARLESEEGLTKRPYTPIGR